MDKLDFVKREFTDFEINISKGVFFLSYLRY